LLNIERDLLALDQPAHSGAFKRRGVNENILAAIVRLNEAEAFLIVVEDLTVPVFIEVSFR